MFGIQNPYDTHRITFEIGDISSFFFLFSIHYRYSLYVRTPSLTTFINDIIQILTLWIFGPPTKLNFHYSCVCVLGVPHITKYNCIPNRNRLHVK